MNLEAACTVARQVQFPTTERHELLAMLGLLDETGAAILPDPDEGEWKQGTLMPSDISGGTDADRPTKGTFAHIYDGPPVDRSALPQGLRLSPAERDKLQPKPKPVRAAKPRAPRPKTTTSYIPRPSARNGTLAEPVITDACGSLTGRNRHARHGEKLCDACREAYNAWQRARKAEVRAGRPKKGRPRPPCGSPYGRKAHKIRGEEVCDACAEAARKASREAWHRREERRKAELAAEQQEQRVAS